VILIPTPIAIIRYITNAARLTEMLIDYKMHKNYLDLKHPAINQDILQFQKNKIQKLTELGHIKITYLERR